VILFYEMKYLRIDVFTTCFKRVWQMLQNAKSASGAGRIHNPEFFEFGCAYCTASLSQRRMWWDMLGLKRITLKWPCT